MYLPPLCSLHKYCEIFLHDVTDFIYIFQDTAVKQCLTRSVGLIAQTLHVDHLKVRHEFTFKKDLLEHLLVRKQYGVYSWCCDVIMLNGCCCCRRT